MELTPPLVITPRLLAGIRIGDDWLSVDPLPDRRWRYAVDTPTCSHFAADLCGPHTPAAAIKTLIAFLVASAESYRSTMAGRESDNADLFPVDVAEWAYVHDQELSLAAMELERLAD